MLQPNVFSYISPNALVLSALELFGSGMVDGVSSGPVLSFCFPWRRLDFVGIQGSLNDVLVSLPLNAMVPLALAQFSEHEGL